MHAPRETSNSIRSKSDSLPRAGDENTEVRARVPAIPVKSNSSLSFALCTTVFTIFTEGRGDARKQLLLLGRNLAAETEDAA